MFLIYRMTQINSISWHIISWDVPKTNIGQIETVTHTHTHSIDMANYRENENDIAIRWPLYFFIMTQAIHNRASCLRKKKRTRRKYLQISKLLKLSKPSMKNMGKIVFGPDNADGTIWFETIKITDKNCMCGGVREWKCKMVWEWTELLKCVKMNEKFTVPKMVFAINMYNTWFRTLILFSVL